MRRVLPCILFVLAIFATSVAASSTLWTSVPLAQRGDATESEQPGRFYRLELALLKQALDVAGNENGTGIPAEIRLPVSNGSIQRFSVVNSPIMEPYIAARYPEFKTYKIRGIDDPLASGRLSFNPSGFRGMVRNAEGVSYIDAAPGGLYRQYARKSVSSSTPFSCGVRGHDRLTPVGENFSRRLVSRTPGVLKTYRLAVAATAEYVATVGNGNATAALAEINNAINRVNEIFERDLGVRLLLVTGTNTLYTNSVTDPYTDDEPELLIDENQTNLDSVVGNANYDIGHVFSTGGGGLAGVGVTCESGFKAQGVTGISNPTGDAFYIDFVAHELGHQFDASHSFNGSTFNCGGAGRSSNSAWEPGSGSTIMAYAGICRGENIQARSDALFHAGSISQIDNYVSSGSGNSCGSNIAITNANEPVLNAGSNYTIPSQTPFELVAIATGADAGETIEYTWDQMDIGTATTESTLGQDLGSNALFRSYLPRAQTYRHFPALKTTLNNLYDRSEVLPCQSRSLNFRVTARDGNSGQDTDNVLVTVDGNSGPFRITSFNSIGVSISAGQPQIIEWDVAGTNVAPVNCTQVDISLLTFNANATTYAETLLLAATANDGRQSVNIPNQSASRARFKLRCSDNVFYDISNSDVAILGGTSAFATSGKTVFENSQADPDMLSSVAPICETPVTNTPANSSGGGGVLTVPGLSWLFGLYAWRRLRFREYISR